MDSAHHSSTYSAGSSSGSSGPYADIESASNLRLLSHTNNSASVIFQGRKSSSRRSTVLSVIALVVSTLCLLGIAGFFGFWFFFVNDSAFLSGNVGREAEVCLPCLQVSPNPLESSPSDLWAQLDVRYDAENDTKICCAVNSAQFAALFKLILQRQEEVKKLADMLDSDAEENTDNLVPGGTGTGARAHAVSAHLVFKPTAQPSSDKIQQWKSPEESPVSHVKEGLRFNNNRIYVQSAGLYFVYCQVLYTPSEAQADDSTIASTYVRRFSILRPSAASFLLKARHTRHMPAEDRQSSYVGGVFQLYKGDTLYVQVSRPDLVSHDDVASFFGLFKVGQ